MGVIIPSGYGQAKVRWQKLTGGPEVICTFGVDVDVTINVGTNAQTINTLLKAAGRPAASASFSTSWVYKGVELTQNVAGAPFVGTADESIVGTTSMTPCPPNVAFLMRKNTSRGGRRGRGRMFLPPCFVSETNVDGDGVIGNTQLLAVQVLWNSLLTALTSQPMAMVLLHDDGSTPDVVTSLSLDALVATQRRRMRR